MHKEHLSALMDGDLSDKMDLNSLAHDDQLQKDWRSYHLIRDVIQGETQYSVQYDIATKVAAALEHEETYSTASAALESQPEPKQWAGFAFFGKLRGWNQNMMQMGVAASVAIAAIFGVQHLNQPTAMGAESPAFNTMPLISQPSPVSFGIPVDSFQVRSRAVTMSTPDDVNAQNERINRMVKEYENQRALAQESQAADAKSEQSVK